MSLYFELGNKLSSSIIGYLIKIDPKVGFIVGGGLGYDSIKYKTSTKTGDFDFLCLTHNEEKLYQIVLESKKYLKKVGLSNIKTPTVKDLELFKEKVVSFLSVSGTIMNTKASINISTKKRFEYLMETNQLFYKARSNERFNLFIARGSNGKDIVVCRLSPEISKLYDDGNKHYLLPNRMFFYNGDFVHLGIYSDFIAKGRIIQEDSNKTITKFQRQMWKLIAGRASIDILKTRSWHKMFASSQYFSQTFINKINKSISALNIEKSTAIKPKYNHKSLIVLFAERKYYKNKLLSDSSKNYDFDDLKFGKTLANYLATGNKGVSYLDAIHLVNSEAVKLTDLISKLGFKKRKIRAPNISSENTLTDNEGKFSYKRKKLLNLDFCKELKNLTAQDIHRFETKNNYLLNFVTKLRKEVINYVCKKI